MPDAADLFADLAARYRVERELGRGGMATVYLAHDLRHDRPVAVKVMRTELGASLGADRFLQEIRIAARLRHPHILPVHDSGEAGGQLWYTMPFVEGESLRQRLTRGGPLPLDDALRVATQVLGALAYAHAQGIVHRDIKPENILLEGDQAVVADFGVARAVSAAGEARLTGTGLAMGTPAYMSPEQATAARDLDGRSDVYAMGCVLYEMLAGQAPFVGATAQQLLARHAIDPVPSLHTVRATVPANVEEAIGRALAKAPVDRFTTASEFADALNAPRSGPFTPATTRALPHSRRVMMLVGAAAVAAVGIIAFLARPRANAPLDPNLVAVVPFRVAGAASELGYLREGMIDLMAARLTGQGTARAVEPRSLMTEWRKTAGSSTDDLTEDASLGVARRVGAGKLLLGGVVGTPGHVTLSASLLTVAGGGSRAEARAEGAADSLPQLVDRLIARLITEGADAAQAVDGLANTPLPALRLYLEGHAAYRRGEYSDAVMRFSKALDIDSTFALAGMALASAAGWTVAPGAAHRGLERAWMNRNRLSERDAALVAAEVGPRFPETSTLAQHLAAWERAVDLAPDQADRWYELGDTYFHEGFYLQIPSTRQRAAQAFRRSVAIDSNTGALGHLLEAAVLSGDTMEVRRLGPVYLARDSSGELRDFYRWRIAEGTGDDGALSALRAEYGRMSLQSLWRIMNHAALDGNHMGDADAAALAIRAMAGRGSDWQRSKTYLHAFESNRGRPSAALGDTARPGETEYGPHAALYERVLDALYGDGDTASASAAAGELARAARAGIDSVARIDLCVSTLWRSDHGDLAGSAETIKRLRRVAAEDSPQTRTMSSVCAALLEAKSAVASRESDARTLVDRLDSLVRDGPAGQRSGPPIAFTLSAAYVRTAVGISPVGFEDFAPVEIARMRERLGDVPAALAAIRRHAYSYHLSDYLAIKLREEGRLAALSGDRAGAARAYRHYLSLRSDAEPSLRPKIDSVRAELSALGAAR